jgi:hypothetical protein
MLDLAHFALTRIAPPGARGSVLCQPVRCRRCTRGGRSLQIFLLNKPVAGAGRRSRDNLVLKHQVCGAGSVAARRH